MAPANLPETKTFQFCKISRPETMAGKIRHLVSESKNISLRNRGKVFPYKQQDSRTAGRKDTAFYKRLLALTKRKEGSA